MVKKRSTFYIEEHITEALKELSKKSRVPATQYVQEALEDLLKKYDVELPKKEDA